MLPGNYVQWLTLYEAANVAWKEARLHSRLSREEAVEFIKLVSDALKLMKMLDPRGLEEEIVTTAYDLAVTAYDASYVVLAKRYGLILVTEDKRLASKASGVVEAASLNELPAA